MKIIFVKLNVSCIFFCLIFINNLSAQYSKNTTLTVLTNNSSRTWHLDPIVTTLGGCLEEELKITFKNDQTAEFQYCQNGFLTKKLIKWNIHQKSTTNEWDIIFSEKLQFQSNEKIVIFDTNRIKLLSKVIAKKGVKMDLSISIPQKNLSTKILVYNFISIE